jgi:hypothetical protein
VILERWQLDISKTSLFISRKTSKNPFSIFFEFRDPTNNLTLTRYLPDNNPFERFDFEKDIPTQALGKKPKVMRFTARGMPPTNKDPTKITHSIQLLDYQWLKKH